MAIYIGANKIGRIILGALPSAFDADYQAILTYATSQGYTLPSSGQQTIQNQLVLDLKTAGAWNGLEFFYVFATDGDRNYAKINWANPGTYNATEVSTPTFTSDVGFTGTGTTGLDSTYVPSTYGGGGDVSMGAWMDLDGGAGTAIGSFATIRTHIIHKFAADNNTFYGVYLDAINSPNAGIQTQTDGLWVTDHDGTSTVRLYVNTSLINSATTSTPEGFSTVSLTMLTRKRSNTPTYDAYSTSTIQMGFFGDRAVGQNIYTPFNDYLAAI
jgi:hypothetical protein